MFRWIMSVGVLAILGGVALAQCYSRPVYSNYYYSQPYYYPQKEVVIKEVAVPVAVPVLVPAAVFQYLPALQPVQQVEVPNQVKASDIDRLVRERVDAVLRDRLGVGAEPPPLIIPGEVSSPPVRDSAELLQKVSNILGTTCASCHTTPDKTSGDVTLFVRKDNTYTLQPNVSKDKILEVIEGKRMPPKKPDAITPEMLAVLKEWQATP